MNDFTSQHSDSANDLPTDLRSLVWVPDAMETLIETQDHASGTETQAKAIRLFWDDPPWDYIDPSTADRWASAVASEQIAVAGLRREVAPKGEVSKWIDESDFPRILPYRNERFGVQATDFERVDFIDIRLDRYVAPDGRAIYRKEFLTRMGIETASSDVASMSMPPELTSAKHLTRTIEALRAFAPDATQLLASISAVSLSVDLPKLVRLGFDGFVLRADSDAFAGLPLASIVNQIRTQLNAAGFPETTLWVVPPPMTADDMAKLIALGADAIACDQWCDQLLWTPIDSTASRSGGNDIFHETLRSEFGRQIDRVRGLVEQAILKKSKPVLATTSPLVSETLGIGLLGGSRRPTAPANPPS